MEVIHIPIIALIHLGLIYVWNLKVRKRDFKTLKAWPFAAFGSLFNVWGLDVLMRELAINSLLDMLKITTACWLVFVLSTNAKYIPIYSWSKRDFWLDYGSEWAGFLIAGTLVFVAT